MVINHTIYQRTKKDMAGGIFRRQLISELETLLILPYYNTILIVSMDFMIFSQISIVEIDFFQAFNWLNKSKSPIN